MTKKNKENKNDKEDSSEEKKFNFECEACGRKFASDNETVFGEFVARHAQQCKGAGSKLQADSGGATEAGRPPEGQQGQKTASQCRQCGRLGDSFVVSTVLSSNPVLAATGWRECWCQFCLNKHLLYQYDKFPVSGRGPDSDTPGSNG